MRAICVVLLDGLGDRAYPELAGRSSNEAARTPVLDGLSADGSCGLLWPLGPGQAPSSELAHWAMFGFLPEEFPGRAVLEALGHGLAPRGDAVYAYASLRAVERDGGGLRVTGRARHAELPSGHPLLAATDVAGFRFRPYPVGGGEAVLEVTGAGADDRLTDTDPFFRDRDPVLDPRPLVAGAGAMAAAVATWTRQTLCDRSDGQTLVVTTKWWGRVRSLPTFAERHGLAGVVIGASPFVRGLALATGLDAVAVSDTSEPGTDLRHRLQAAGEAVAAGASFVWVHTKAVDEAGHTKQPHHRVAVLEELDPVLAVLREPPFQQLVVCVTGDHATPCAPELIHSGDPVPFVVHGPGVRADRTQAFGELECGQGLFGRLRGEDVMPVLLNAADRVLFAGSRPTSVPAPAGHPTAPAGLAAVAP